MMKHIGILISAVWVSVVLFCSPCSALTVSLSWDANTETTLAGYKVYYKADSITLPFDGTGAVEGTSPVDVHNQTTATVSGLDPNRAYYFAVTAYDTSGLESTYSNIVTILESVSADDCCHCSVKLCDCKRNRFGYRQCQRQCWSDKG